MILRILIIALDNYVSVVSVNDKGKSSSIPFDGEVIFKVQDDFWSVWCLQTSYVAPKADNNLNATVCDFCIITDKDYSFAKDNFLDSVLQVKESFWKVEKIEDVLCSLEILKNYNSISIKMPNDISFSVRGENADGKAVEASTNISDMEYKHKVEERKRIENEKRENEKKAISERKSENRKASEDKDEVPAKQDDMGKYPKKKVHPISNGEESAIVRYNKKLIAEEKSNE